MFGFGKKDNTLGLFLETLYNCIKNGSSTCYAINMFCNENKLSKSQIENFKMFHNIVNDTGDILRGFAQSGILEDKVDLKLIEYSIKYNDFIGAIELLKEKYND